MGLPEDRRGSDALVARGGRHTDVGQDDVRRVVLDGLEERGEVRARADNRDVRLAGEYLLEAFPYDEVVVGYDDADRHEATIVGDGKRFSVDTSPREGMRAPLRTLAGAIVGARRVGQGVGGLKASAVKVMTVDDQAVFRVVARRVIEATAGFEHVGEATTGEQALALADELDPDLIFIDVRMPGIDGLETARRLRSSHPKSTTVLISTAAIASLPRGFASCGAAAFVRKQDFGPSLLRRLWTEHGRRSEP